MARIAKTTQAELERALRAVENAGLKVTRVLARTDGYAIETDAAANGAEHTLRIRPKL